MRGRWHGGAPPSARRTSARLTYDANGVVLDWGPANENGTSWYLLVVSVWVKDLTRHAREAWVGEDANEGSTTWFHFGTYFVAEFSQVQATIDSYALQGVYENRRVIIEEWCWNHNDQWHMFDHT